MKRAGLFVLALLVPFALASCARQTADEGSQQPEATSEEGAFFAVEANADESKLLVTLPAPDDDGVMLRAIHASGLTAGLGSNPVGFDRGAVENGRIIAFRKTGKKVVIEQENWTYRASAENALEKKSVANSFARSFLWAGDVETVNADGSVVDSPLAKRAGNVSRS